jgi:protein-disulfide isomerase
MSLNARIALIVTSVAVLLTVIVVAILVTQRPVAAPPAANPATQLPATLRDDTHVLQSGSDDVVLVEFLDFECESCGAVYPYVEQLREEYDGRVTFAIRYFPLPGHGNAVNAAVAAEAAARQGRLDEMYSQLFTTQASWGERGSSSQADIFRGFAQDLGLDMQQYDADVRDPAVLERVQSDFEDGRALGVDSTPTFFLNDERIELRSIDDLRNAIEAELSS